jgi:hypothetical protein
MTKKKINLRIHHPANHYLRSVDETARNFWEMPTEPNRLDQTQPDGGSKRAGCVSTFGIARDDESAN